MVARLIVVERIFEEGPQPPRDRAEWLRALDARTERWREWRASELERAGERLVLVDLGSDETAEHYVSIGPGLWHRQRAKAHRERFDRLGECGLRERVQGCDCGKCRSRVTLWCDHWRLCLSCRGRRARIYREKLEAGRRECLVAYADRIKRRDQHRWSERFLTATVPHSGSVSRDVDALRQAWGPFVQAIKRYLWRRKLGWREVPYWRSMEITPSDVGHAHYHVWLLGPYLPRELLRHWWGRALPAEYQERLPRVALIDALEGSDPRNHAELRRAARLDGIWADHVRACERAARKARHRYGRDDYRARALSVRAREERDRCAWLYAPVFDVRKISDAEDLSKYMAKGIVNYLVKDADPASGLTDVDTYAAIYEALEGARVVATSVHWAVLPDERTDTQKRFCDGCGAEWQVLFLDSVAPARGPPSVHTFGITPKRASHDVELGARQSGVWNVGNGWLS